MNNEELKDLTALLELYRHSYPLDSAMDNVYIAYLLKDIEERMI